ncbi:MAG: hypothetical protein VX738_10455 [Planctomycetota bacterium]|nr:hypothetical protein [Planctomycetota bacterium]
MVNVEVQALISILQRAGNELPEQQRWPVAIDTWFTYCDDQEMQSLFQELLQLKPPQGEREQAAWGRLIDQFVDQQRKHGRTSGAPTGPARQDLMDLYHFLGAASTIRQQVLLLLAMQTEDASTEAMVSLLIHDPPAEVSGFAVALSPYLQRDTSWDLLFPALFQALKHPVAAAAIIDLANYLCRADKVTPHPAAEITVQLEGLLKGVVEQLSMIEDGSILKSQPDLTAQAMAEQVNQGVGLAVSLCDAIALTGNEETTAILFQAMSLGHRRVQVEAAAALVRLQQDGGRQRLVTLAEEPAVRVRVLHYAEELAILDEVDSEYKTDVAVAEGKLALHLAEPHIMGLAPRSMELYEQAELFWPGFDDVQTCSLFRYEYIIGDKPLMNIGLGAPEVQSVRADLTHLSPEDIYALFAADSIVHEEIFEMDADDLDSQAELDKVRLTRRLHDRGYSSIQPVHLGFFFGDRVLTAYATRDDETGVVVVDASDDHWFCSRSEVRPLMAQDVYNIYKGRKLLLTFNPDFSATASPTAEPDHE